MVDCEAFASAPGKLILFGEHSVVYGYTAVAAALSDMRISVHACATPSDMLEASLLDLPGVAGEPVSLCARLTDLRAALAGLAQPDWRAPAPPSAEAVAAFTAALESQPPADASALVPLLFLCHALLPELFIAEDGECPSQRGNGTVSGGRIAGLRLAVRSAALPVGAGLGSSAAFSVSLAAALLRLRLTLHPAEASTFGCPVPVEAPATFCASECPCDAAKQLIDGWAFAAECILHGTPSGLDSAVSCAGFAMRVVSSSTSGPKRFERVADFPALRVLLTNTLVPRKTREKVAGVRQLHNRHKGIVTNIFRAIGALAEDFLGIAGRASPLGADDFAHLASLVTLNHQLLCALGVSGPQIEEVRSIAASEGLATKLTGAGGGGCTFTLIDGSVPASEAAAVATRLQTRLEAQGFVCYPTTVGGHGVLWHRSLPTVTRSGAAASCSARAPLRAWALLGLAGVAVAGFCLRTVRH